MFDFLYYTLLPFILILGLLILIHELGHFLTARLFGVGVKEFAIGFPPRIKQWQGKETVYSLGAIPLGGYVRLVGEDESENEAPDSFQVKPPWQRFIILFAGSATHFVLAFLIFFGLTWAYGESIPNDKVFIVETAIASPAAAAGLEAGDQVIMVAGEPITRTEEFLTQSNAFVGSELTLTVLGADASAPREVTLVPRQNPPSGEGALGVSIAQGGDLVAVGMWRSMQVGASDVGNVIEQTIAVVGQLVSDIFLHGRIPAGISGPVGIAKVTGDVAKGAGLLGLLTLAGILAANLAVVNLLPYPALDGGRIIFVLWEWIFRRRIAPQHEALVHTLGFACLLILLLAVTVVNDIF